MTAIPYCGTAPSPAELLGRWNADPVLLAALLLAAGALGWGSRAAAPARRGLITAGVALLAILFVSPLCAWSSALFAARVAHHAVMVALAVPLLVAGLPRDRLPSGSLAGWTGAHGMIMWLWHAPQPYAWALASDGGYWVMELSLGASAFGFWAAVRAASPLAGVGALLVTTMQMGLLGALIALAPTPLYSAHAIGAPLWGLTPLEDQQLAGLIMWAPAAGLYLAAALILTARWLGGQRTAVAA